MFDVVEVEFVTSSLGGGEESLPVEVGTSFFPRCFLLEKKKKRKQGNIFFVKRLKKELRTHIDIWWWELDKENETIVELDEQDFLYE